MASLSILVAANVADDRRGGMTRIMGFTGDELCRAGHRVDYFYAAQAARYGVRGKASRFTYPLALYRHVRERWREGRPYDVVNVHEPQGAALVLLRRWAGRPAIVVTSHGCERRAWMLALEEGRLGRGGPSLYTRAAYPATSLWQSAVSLRRADHVFCLNEEDRRFITSRYHRRPESVTRIFPGASAVFGAAAVSRDYAAVRSVLFAGTWRKNKGIQDLVPALTALARERPELIVTVLGAGADASEVQADFPSELRTRVRCVTSTNEQETAAVFAAADLFVLPSLFEGTPLTLVEAMASGLPIVTTATCGMADVIRNGENGLLVPIRAPEAVTDALRQLMADPALRRRLGLTARADAEQRYTWPVVAAPLRAVYERLAAARRD